MLKSNELVDGYSGVLTHAEQFIKLISGGDPFVLGTRGLDDIF